MIAGLNVAAKGSMENLNILKNGILTQVVGSARFCNVFGEI